MRRVPPFASNGPNSTKGYGGPNILLSMGGKRDTAENISPRGPGGPKGTLATKDPN